MAKRIVMYRHGHALHNVANDWSIPDAPLSDTGREQASGVSSSALGAWCLAHADLIVTSPLRRTLQTTLLAFPPPRRPPVLVLPQLQEITPHPCDTGSSRQTLTADPEFASFDLSALPDDWNDKARWPSDDQALRERARWVRRWLRTRPESVVVVVSHAGFLRWVTTGHNDHSVWDNVEARVWEFADEADEAEAALRQVALEG